MSPRGRWLALACALALAVTAGACTKDAGPRRALTERERDSTLGKSVIPGGAAVTRALAVSDSATARSLRMDGAIAGQ
jgi:hypothetical protein